MSQMASITETGTYVIEPPDFDSGDKKLCKSLLSSLSVAGRTFGMVLVNRTLNHGIGVRVMHIDHRQHKLAAERYRPWGCEEKDVTNRSEMRRKKARLRLKNSTKGM